MSYSGDRSSTARKRALRRLAREQRGAYRELYTSVQAHTQTHDQARGRARTLLRYRYPDRYLQLYAEERAGPGAGLPPHIRSKAWLKANATLAGLLAPAYHELFEQMRANGLNDPCAYDMATTQLRRHNAELFADVLIDEIRLCLAGTEPPAAPAACPSCGSTSHRPGRDLCPNPCGQIHPRCLACGAALGQCHWHNARTAPELLTTPGPTIIAAFCAAAHNPQTTGPRKQYRAREETAVTIDDKLTAAAATIAHMPEAKIRARLEQLHARHGSPAHTGALEDGLDGGPADETVRFCLDGAAYEIDLNTKNASAFHKQLTPFIEHARKAGRTQPGRSARTVASRRRSGDIRAWAKDHGISVSERGRIPVRVVEQ
jgi:nucleoid-associated protein Lsr2